MWSVSVGCLSRSGIAGSVSSAFIHCDKCCPPSGLYHFEPLQVSVSTASCNRLITSLWICISPIRWKVTHCGFNVHYFDHEGGWASFHMLKGSFFLSFFTLQYCVGFAIHQHESATGVHMFPSWTPFPPPSPYHPSGSSQCTSPKLPVSCIKPGLVIHFIYDIIHVSMPFSQSSHLLPLPQSPVPFHVTVDHLFSSLEKKKMSFQVFSPFLIRLSISSV